MVSLSCCAVDCLQQNFQVVNPHTCVWDCEGGQNRSGDDPFYANFERLPHEMKIHCLSFCKFHALANTELWLRDEDTVYFEKTVLQDRHLTRAAGFTELYDFNVNHSQMLVCTPGHVLSCKTRTEIGDLQKPFGNVNFYPSFYFRACTHFDRPTEELNAKGRRVLYTRYARPPRLHDDILKLDLSPGLYYWELLHYRWENALADSSGDCSRQKHFHINPSDSSHDAPSPGEDSAFPMSLLYRRVVHPSAEVHDRFVAVATFANTPMERADSIYFSFDDSDAGEGETSHAGESIHVSFYDSDSVEHRIFSLKSDESDGHTQDRGGQAYYQKMSYQKVYKHFHCPTYGLVVFKHHVRADKKQSNKVGYYFVSLPHKSRLVSLDRNSTTVRLNLLVDPATTLPPLPQVDYGYLFQ